MDDIKNKILLDIENFIPGQIVHSCRFVNTCQFSGEKSSEDELVCFYLAESSYMYTNRWCTQFIVNKKYLWLAYLSRIVVAIKHNIILSSYIDHPLTNITIPRSDGSTTEDGNCDNTRQCIRYVTSKNGKKRWLVMVLFVDTDNKHKEKEVSLEDIVKLNNIKMKITIPPIDDRCVEGDNNFEHKELIYNYFQTAYKKWIIEIVEPSFGDYAELVHPYM